MSSQIGHKNPSIKFFSLYQWMHAASPLKITEFSFSMNSSCYLRFEAPMIRQLCSYGSRAIMTKQAVGCFIRVWDSGSIICKRKKA